MTDIVSKNRASDRSEVANRLLEIFFRLKSSSVFVDIDKCLLEAKSCLDYFDIDLDFDVTDSNNVFYTLDAIKEVLSPSIKALESTRTNLSDYVWELDDAYDDRDEGYYFLSETDEREFFKAIHDMLTELGLAKPLHDKLDDMTLDKLKEEPELIGDLCGYRL